MVTNSMRAEWARAAVDAFINTHVTEDDLETNIRDLICDLLHLARRECDVTDLVQFAQMIANMAEIETVEDPEDLPFSQTDEVPMSQKSKLARRLTHKYVGTYRHLDEWEEIGTIEQIHREVEVHDDFQITTLWLIVDSDRPESEIEQAIRDHFNVSGCAHTHDCCGCTSSFVRSLVRRTGDLWKVEVYSYQNY